MSALNEFNPDLLPRWTRVLFAARCGRWAASVVGNIPTVEVGVLRAAEKVAEFAGGSGAPGTLVLDDLCGSLGHGDWAACAVRVLTCASSSVKASKGVLTQAHDENAKTAARSAVRFAVRSGVSVADLAVDFDRLAAAARAGNWTDTTPAPPGTFSPVVGP